jgi:hypothetical protein
VLLGLRIQATHQTPDHPDEVALLLWNLHHLCWDDTSGDDFRCAAEYVSHWMPAPAVPAVEVPDGK